MLRLRQNLLPPLSAPSLGYGATLNIQLGIKMLEQMLRVWNSWLCCGSTVLDSAAIGKMFFQMTFYVSAGIFDAIASEYVEVACVQRKVRCLLEQTQLRRSFDLFASAQSSAA